MTGPRFRDRLRMALRRPFRCYECRQELGPTNPAIKYGGAWFCSETCRSEWVDELAY